MKENIPRRGVFGRLRDWNSETISPLVIRFLLFDFSPCPN